MRRAPGPWSPAVIALLRHLSGAGFDACPVPIGTGFDGDGNELLQYVEGESPHPAPWSDEAVARLGAMVAAMHRATRGLELPAGARWREGYGRAATGAPAVIGHGDLGPWNILAREGLPVAIIDWDYAGPVDPVDELAQLAWLNAQLHDDDVAERAGLPDAAARARQVALVLDGYGLPRGARAGFVDRMVAHAVHSARADAIEHGVSETSTQARAADGFPVLWSITWRARSASWMLRHRRLLEAAL